ncbi:TIGR00375 family protein [Methanococcoides burtonii]|uniref:Protein with PHP C-terminal domain n=1 Tax=Methanococcoides burtonii (strain DSM 6242 / NBRC 107633 / OCM 468 / ACE-M) TaxID=259564 RepID=Q12W62_METBU|nr:TIGR00375 family protein [Methanococcoides burtonii]ABE52314.1 protein with PHP C-terminal domain [Methanococcoides burtonii DSM 6242]
MQINADLHLHSKYSMACSKNMELSTISIEAKKKGIDLVATGDCIHPKWLEEIKQAATNNETIFINETHFIPTTEIEDKNRVHHLLILPSISKAEELAEAMSKYGNLAVDGRPTVRLDGCEIAQIAKEVGALIGPCHAFTPWTALYAHHDSLGSCYGDMTDYISFLELGLSADSDYADRISELHRLTFLTNSDAHSPWSNKLAREFTRFEVPSIDFEGLEKAILRKEGYKATLNVGFFPGEGKYNESACIKCYTHYTHEECIRQNWRCSECRGLIKKGVHDRVNELADLELPEHPDHRPDYLHLAPLAEIIMMALGHASITTKGVTSAWTTLIEKFGNEVAVLLDTNSEQLNIVDQRIVDAIMAFRNGEVIIHPGGGGEYGHIELPGSKNEGKEPQNQNKTKAQSSLFDF